MAKYLVTCACGRQLVVETGQAGESISCECGARVVVPTLRQLRTLPVATDATTTAATGSNWGMRQGAITVSLLLAVLFLALAGLSRISEVPVPVFDPAAQSKSIDQKVSNLTPLDAWQVWIANYRTLSLTGFEVFKHPATDAMQITLDWHRAIQKTLMTLAAACVVAAAVLAFAGGGKKS